ncbi:MAG: amidase [Treponema sp.]|nr:amidase [Treponema sp.]
MKLEALNAFEIGTLVNEKRISPTEVITYFLERIEKRNKAINAFVYVQAEYALAKAKELEARLAKGEDCGPFAGVPFALKDFLPNKKGWQSSHGGVRCLLATDESDSVFCQAMEKAGGIAIGKTNAPAYGFRGTTDNLMYGATATPFNTDYNSGGSSGGSAAAVADGLVPIAEGGDAGGSIRIPASFCNLYGFKAGVGTIPSVCRPDAWSATHPLCFNGGLTKSVTDAAILLNYMSYQDTRDPFSLPKTHDFFKELSQCPQKLKIAYTADFGLFEVEDEVRTTVNKTVEQFQSIGCSVEEYQFDFTHSAYTLAELWCKGITIDCALDLNHLQAQGIDLLKEHAQDFPQEFIYWKEIVDKLGIEDLYAFNLARTDVLDQFESAFESYDLILSPISSVAGIKNASNNNTKGPESIHGKKVEPLIGWTQTFLANFTGNPAASIPAGLSRESVPIGMQLIAPRHQDMLLLQASKMYEDAFSWKKWYSLAMNRKV